MAFDRKYELLTCESNSTDDDCEHDTFSQVGSFTARQQVSQWGIPIRMLSIFNGMLLVLNLLLMSIASGKIWSSSTRPGTLLPGYQTDYLGIQGQVQVETRAFVNQLRPNESSKEWEISFDENTPRYTGIPNAEIDRSWHNLLAGMNFNTTLEDAPFLRNRTYNFPDGQHLVGLEVYHALHCLNKIRMILYPDVYSFTVPRSQTMRHADHCLDYLRQYVQCNADLTPMYFENVDHAGLLLKVETKHTCARFDQIQQWVETKRTTEAPPGFG